MAITALSSDVKKLTFDGETSASYGVRILGTGVFNAPQRATRAITVPGRNGSVMMDLGRFENIEVTYPANLVADNPEDFAAAMSEFRNFLCSKKGYCRLEDDYNPGEYRLAMYKGGLEVSEKVLKAGEFNITFTCKPQRFLTSGETEVTVASGGTITNPTPFDSQPIISAEGEGTISSANWNIEVLHRSVGLINLFPTRQETASLWEEFNEFSWFNRQSIDTNLLRYNDEIYPGDVLLTFNVASGRMFYPASVSESGVPGAGLVPGVLRKETKSFSIRIPGQTINFRSGSSYTHTTTIRITEYAPSQVKETWTFETTVKYARISPPGTSEYFNAVCVECIVTHPDNSLYTINTATATMQPVTAYSTVFPSGVIIIDCETGEAYIENDGSFVSANSSISLGTDLPTLAPGANEITYDNTVTSLKITPRWWKI